MNSVKHLAVGLLVILCVGCKHSDDISAANKQFGSEHGTAVLEENTNISNSLAIEATSFTGNPLYRRSVDAEKIEKFEKLIKELSQKDTLSEDEYIALGGYYVAIYRFQDAIAVYSRGLQLLPHSFKLRSLRAHRYISVRELDKAIVDLNEARVLIEKSPSRNAIEYSVDGTPHGSYELWIWYHTGLYHYLKTNYAEAAKAYEKCIEVSPEDKYLVSTVDWLYNSYQKLGDTEAVDRVLKILSPDMNLDKGHPYFKRIMLYKGEVKIEDIFDQDKPVEKWTARDMTIAYGVANWSVYQGNSKDAEKIYKNILTTPFWNTWAYIAAEKEYAH